MKPSTVVRGGRAWPSKADSLRSVAISTGTGMPYLRSVRSAASCQLLSQPSFWSKTAHTSLMLSGAEAQADSDSSSTTDTIRLKRNLPMRLASTPKNLRESCRGP
jgi:hypothetical protein